MLTGDAANADPVCDKSPYHGVVAEAVARAQRPDAAARAAEQPLVFRDPKESRRLSQSPRKEAAVTR